MMQDIKTYSAEPFSASDLADQEERLCEIQSALYHARVLMDGLHFERMDPREIHAAAYFASFALEHLADSMADDAVKFAMRHKQIAKQNQHETGMIQKGAKA